MRNRWREAEVMKSIEKLQQLLEEIKDGLRHYHEAALRELLQEDV
jgi:hypothetical protein